MKAWHFTIVLIFAVQKIFPSFVHAVPSVDMVVCCIKFHVWFQWLYRYHHQTKIQRNFCRAAMLPFYILKEKLSSPKWHIFKDILLYIISEQWIVTLVGYISKDVSLHVVISDWEIEKVCCLVGLQWHHICSRFPENQPAGLKVEMCCIHTHKYSDFLPLIK